MARARASSDRWRVPARMCMCACVCSAVLCTNSNLWSIQSDILLFSLWPQTTPTTARHATPTRARARVRASTNCVCVHTAGNIRRKCQIVSTFHRIASAHAAKPSPQQHQLASWLAGGQLRAKVAAGCGVHRRFAILDAHGWPRCVCAVARRKYALAARRPICSGDRSRQNAAIDQSTMAAHTNTLARQFVALPIGNSAACCAAQL